MQQTAATNIYYNLHVAKACESLVLQKLVIQLTIILTELQKLVHYTLQIHILFAMLPLTPLNLVQQKATKTKTFILLIATFLNDIFFQQAVHLWKCLNMYLMIQKLYSLL
jgi:hypothetical protein